MTNAGICGQAGRRWATLDITWYGHSCFRISERGRISVVTDPFHESIGLPPLKLKADVVTVSHEGAGHSYLDAVKTDMRAVHTPGEYEIGGVFITALALHNPAAEPPQRNVGFMVNYDTLSVLHVGDLSFVPEQSTIENLGEVNVLLVPVGGGGGLKAAQAAELVALVEPHFIVPMHYALPGLAFELEPVDKFLKVMGVSKVVEMDILKVSSSDLPEQPQVVVLTPQGMEMAAG
jgi:L-ascorbate metabolism protein UlaG (beta-lactamase superfamily)